MKPDLCRPDLLELAAGYAEDAVIVTTADLELPGPQFLYVNSAFTRMTGYSAAELLGKTPRILQGKATDRRTLDRLRSELDSGNEFVARTTNYRRDGSAFEIEWIISHIRDSDGKTTHYIAIQRDITGKQRAETELHKFDEELRETSRQLLETLRSLELAERRAVHRERLAALGEMAAGITHDLSNSLSPQLNVLELLNQSDNLSAHEHALVKLLRESTDHAIELVRNLRQFNQLDQSDDLTEMVDLCDLVKSVREITRPKWEIERRASGVQIRFDLRLNAVPAVRGNRTELRQVLVNLIYNAVDSIETSGVLTIGVSRLAGDVLVEIADTGCGMSSDVMLRCFEPYFTTKGAGKGFGLSVCHGLVAKHGGRIEVSSSIGNGTQFRLILPAENEPSTDAPDASC